MNLGRYQIGRTVHLRCLTVNADGTPTLPDAPPVAVIQSGQTVITVKTMPILDRAAQTGLFHYPLLLDSYFSLATYTVNYRWDISTFAGLETDTFTVIAGGDADGAITALYFYRRPHADFLVQGTETGKIRSGRNPRV